MKSSFPLPIVILLAAATLACGLAAGPPTATPVPPSVPPPLPSPTPIPTASVPPEPVPTPLPATLLAWVQGGQLLVTDVTGGLEGGTTQYTTAGVDDEVHSLVWSPSGEFVAFTGRFGDSHVFFVFAAGAGTPVDLGAGQLPGWSPDSASVAYESNGNLWVTPIESPVPRQLTFQTGWAWGNPVFTRDGSAVIAAGAPTEEMGAQGNVGFYLYRVPLDGSGTLAPLPTEIFFGRLPYELALSPDGSRLGFWTSAHVDACASPSAYFVGQADGSGVAAVISPTIQAALDPAREIYQEGFSLAWLPAGDGVAVHAFAWDCSGILTGADPRVVAGPLVSVMGLDGVERTTLPVDLFSLSFDRTGNLIAGAQTVSNVDPPRVQIYSALDGTLLLDLGEGTLAALQP
jgi:hypothetical protein